MIKRVVVPFLLLLGALIAYPPPAFAEGLVVTPKRVVVGSRERESRVTLSNLSDEETTYRLYFVNYLMTADGEFMPVTSPAEAYMPASSFVRYSPRQVKLPPGETQIVRLMVRTPPSAKFGEFRSHLVIQAIPKAQKEKHFQVAPGRTQTSIQTVYGISIPVIVRRGKPTATVSIGDNIDLHEVQGQSRAGIVLKRVGDASVYGDLMVYGRTASDSTWSLLGQSLGVAVYTPLTERHVVLPLNRPITDLSAVKVEYRNPDLDKPIALTTRQLR